MKNLLLLLVTFISLGLGEVHAQNTTETEIGNSHPKTEVNQPTHDKLTQDSLIMAEAQIKILPKKVDKLTKANSNKDNIEAVFAIVGVFFVPALLVWAALYYRFKQHKAKLTVVEKLLVSNKNISPELYDSIMKDSRPKNSLQKGIKLSFIGIGLTIVFYITFGLEMMSMGILVICIGIGEAIAGYLQRRDERKNAKPMEDVIIVNEYNPDNLPENK